MIEKLNDFPDNVAAYACHGHLTRADYEDVLTPDIEERLTRHQKLRMYIEIAPDFVREDPSAWWDDAKLGLGHFFEWERGALVSDVVWMNRAVQVFAMFMPGKWQAFTSADAGRAREWILENSA